MTCHPLMSFRMMVVLLVAAISLAVAAPVRATTHEIPFELNSGKIYVDVRINKKGPFWMVLDTGSPGMILDSEAARRLSLDLGESFDVEGAGESKFPLSQIEEELDVTVSGMALGKQPAMAGPIDRVVGPFEGRRLDGVLGGLNVFTQNFVEIDFARSTLKISSQDSPRPEFEGATLPIEVREGHVFVKAELQPKEGPPITGDFIVDTGLRGSLILHKPFVDRNDLMTRSGSTAHATTGGGFGGQVWSHVGRARWLKVGSVTVKDLPMDLSQAKEGLLSTDYASGIIGSSFLQRFRVLFDYAGGRLVLDDRGADPDSVDFDKSGTFLISEVDDRRIFRVLDVIDGSAAGEAGLKVGDILKQVGGRPAAEFTLEEVRRMFRGRTGTAIALVIEREGERLEVQLRLKPVI